MSICINWIEVCKIGSFKHWQHEDFLTRERILGMNYSAQGPITILVMFLRFDPFWSIGKGYIIKFEIEPLEN